MRVVSRSWKSGMSIRSLAPAGCLALFTTLALAFAALQPPKDAFTAVAVLFPPGTTLVDAVGRVAEQGGRVERTGKWENLIVASFQDRATPVEALREAGAWLVFDPHFGRGMRPVDSDFRTPGTVRVSHLKERTNDDRFDESAHQVGAIPGLFPVGPYSRNSGGLPAARRAVAGGDGPYRGPGGSRRRHVVLARCGGRNALCHRRRAAGHRGGLGLRDVGASLANRYAHVFLRGAGDAGGLVLLAHLGGRSGRGGGAPSQPELSSGPTRSSRTAATFSGS